MYALIVALFLFILAGIFEYHRHLANRRQIPLVIHVNGTRGKSSVTRLIAAGLRAGGLRTIGKTTGSAPVVIHENGDETPIHRPFSPNIKEQITIIRHAARKRVEALVLECMAVTPEYQWISEHKIVHSDIGVITNSRMDHLDVMGPGIRNVTLSLCNTIPYHKVLFTSESKLLPIMRKQARKHGTETFLAEAGDVSIAEMKGFHYIEHRDNVALALAVCNHLHIDRQTALEGMYRAKPDVGAAEIYSVQHQGQKLFFVHSFAANDPESTQYLIDYVRSLHRHLESVVIVLSTRADRMFRSKQLAQMLSNISFDELFLIGDQAPTVRNYAIGSGINRSKIKACGWVTGDQLLEWISKLEAREILLFGIGNIHGNGGRIVKYFKERNQTND